MSVDLLDATILVTPHDNERRLPLVIMQVEATNAKIQYVAHHQSTETLSSDKTNKFPDTRYVVQQTDQRR